jgi:hypothetical protein
MLSVKGATELTDECAQLFSVANAPELVELNLSGCSGISIQSVVAARAGQAKPLSALCIVGTKPLTGTTESMDAQFASLLSLDDGSNEEYVNVCTAKDGCGQLFDVNDCAACDVCDELFCSKDNHNFSKCSGEDCPISSVCDECLPRAFASGYDDSKLYEGFKCGHCTTMLCGECASQKLMKENTITHVTCGVCDATFCFECGFHSRGLTCSMTLYSHETPECLRFVCDGCYWGIDRENMLLCTTCSMPCCHLCAERENDFKLTGLYNPPSYPSITQGFCTSGPRSCYARRNDKRC